jgi:acetyl esterase/lipase
MVEAGFACAAIDYRLAPATRFPGQTEDVDRAVDWLLDNAGRFGIVRQHVILAGESAGGHLVCFTRSKRVLGVVAFSPPVDLIALGEPGRGLGLVSPEIRALTGATGWSAGDIEAMRRASPLFAVEAQGAPPLLIIFGTADTLVPPGPAREFCGRAAGCEWIPVPGAPHGLWDEERLVRWQSVWYATLVERIHQWESGTSSDPR